MTQSDTPATQLPTVLPKTSGVVLLNVQQAGQWIQESPTISPDELALLVVGRHNLTTTLRAEVVQVPCKDPAGRPVILACTMVQLGERRIKIPNDAHPPIEEEECATISVTMWREDWSEEVWTKILDQPFQHVKRTLQKQGQDDVLQATWGKSIRQNGIATTIAMAESVQFHATVRTTALPNLLATSGYQKIFVVPKTPDGRICQDWRVIWIEGSWAHLSTIAMKTKHAMGIVKNKSSLGIRFQKEHYPEAWKQLCPEKEFPSEIEMAHLYKIEPLPHGTSATMLETWGRNNNWPIKPVKPLGPTTWLAGSDSKAPSDIVKFNGRPLIVKWLAPKSTTFVNPIIAGPPPMKNKGKGKGGVRPETDPYGPHFDPWCNFTGSRQGSSNTTGPTGTQQLAGPTEARLQKQDEQIAAMEARITQLHKDTQHEFLKVEQREKSNQMRMEQSILAVKTDLETAFSKAVTQQSEGLNQSLLDLKQLIQANSKRNRENDDVRQGGQGTAMEDD